ncbi:NAD(P)/FAD-dependent oxidoreductase [Antrihabitans stalactiti]|uniref:FAD-dependent monooxygenase n=1 Tax=Antrihabitans stalactiti TaxID=2584121 RepID=A0A848KGX3_9NOCA|nr:NAD(P)/FAD-dependent oxidoreductase [Antrihabitans stalactiti]NMN98273.1 FAD-dependent monooxygenase [Antrihabitans stalactiti]
MEHFDVAIVGARCAGSPFAVLLARRGLRVCVLDKAHFPSDTPSTHVIQPCGVGILDRIGVLDTVLASGAPKIDRFTLVNDDVRIDGALDQAVFTQPGLCVRRGTLDSVLVEAAGTAGADVRTGTKMTGLLVEDGRVVGVDTEGGPIGARLVVGADGRHSSVAAAVGAAEYDVRPPGRMPAWAYFEGVGDREGRLRLGRRGALAFLASPTDSGLYMAGIAVDWAQRAEFHSNRNAAFRAGIAGWSELADLLGDARRVGPIRVMNDWHSYFRQSAGAGWALLGDAGHFKDFTPAQGIADALRQAERLAEDLPDDLADTAAVDAATQRWWRWRDKDAYPMYLFASDMGAPGTTTPLVNRILRDIATDPEATTRLLRLLNHELLPAQLLNPRRLVLAAWRALRDRPDLWRATGSEIASAVRDGAKRRPAPSLTASAETAVVRALDR